MLNFILQRLFSTLTIVFCASLLIFLLPHLLGIDPVRSIVRARVGDRTVDTATMERLRTELGLDKPLWRQYGNWMGQLLRGDLGYSFVSRSPVAGLLWRAFRVTSILAFSTVLFAFLLALPLGMVSARFQGKALDRWLSSLTQAGIAMPQYWLAPLLVLLFSLELKLLPSNGWRGPQHLILPVLTLALRPLAYFTSLLRAALIDVLAEDYIRTARAKGLPARLVLFKHALRNALIPVTTMGSLWLVGLLGGSVIVEVIFAIPGMGRVIYEAVNASDLPLLQASLLLLVLLTSLIMLLTDLLYKVFNPTISLEQPTF